MTEKKGKAGERIRQGLEWFALCVLAHYCFYQFFSPIMFKFPYDETVHTVNYVLIVTAGTLRLISGLWSDFRRAEGKKEIIRTAAKGLAAIGCTVPCVIVTATYGYVQFVYLPFAAFCLYGTEPEKVLKIHAGCVCLGLALTVLCSLSGAIRNLVYIGWRTSGAAVRAAYGGSYPTGMAAYLVFVFLDVWCASGRKESRIRTLLFICLAGFAAWVIYVYTWSITSTICCLMIAAAALYDRLNEKVLRRRKGTRWITKAVDGLTIGAFPIFCAGTAALTWLYGTGSTIGFRLNQLLSDRLGQMWTSFQKYGIQAFGAKTPQSGWGGNLIKTKEYEFLDNSFSLMFIRYGWVISVIAMLLWMWTTYRAIRSGRRRIALAMTIVLAHSFMEHRFPVIGYNILLAMPLCCFAPAGGEREAGPAGVRETAPAGKKKALAGWIAAAVLAGGIALLLPRTLSWVRCVFEAKGWTGSGNDVLPAFFGWLGVLACLAGLWFAMRRIGTGLLEKRGTGWRAPAGAAAAVCLLAAAAVWMNGEIGQAKKKYAAQTEADKAAVGTILAAAEEPVYAGQLEEIYKRAFGGFSDRVVSPEELGREARGTVLMPHDAEGKQLTDTGARYAELTPYTGVFTYDEAVAQKLREAGYRVHGYYSAEREENLPAYAEQNGGLEVTENGGLIVTGKKKFLYAGPYLQQYEGNYRVTYTLRLKDLKYLEDPEKEICELRVAAMFGKDVRAKKPLRAKDFNPDGTITATLDYSVGETRGVEFKVFGREKIEVWVEKITWRQYEPIDTLRTYTREGWVATERYYNDAGEPMDRGGYCGIAIEHVKNSYVWTRVTYLDAAGNPTQRNDGIAYVTYEVNDRNQFTHAYHYDAEGNLRYTQDY